VTQPDLAHSTLTEVVAALRNGEVSSTELLDAFVDRQDRFGDDYNAVVARDLERARAEAGAADDARARGHDVGTLAGLPMTIKDTFETAGLVTTAGAPILAEHVPTTDADVVEALRSAGAIVYGKTNVPLFAGDHQTYNDVYGITNNAWDPTRTSGGSSGGAAVALALGLTVGEVGSDIGGSIREPSHFNGVFGLKPSHGLISERGHIPGPPGALAPADLSVCGPMGRSVEDLELLLNVLVGVRPFGGVPGAALPVPTEVDVAGLRVGVWADDPLAPVDSSTVRVIGDVVAKLEAAGATVDLAARPESSAERLHEIYQRLLFPVMGAGLPPEVWERQRQLAEEAEAADRSFATNNARWGTASHKAWLGADEARHHAMADWAELFTRVDVVVMATASTPAFPHDTERPYGERTIAVDGVERPYSDILFWAGLAVMPLLPSVAMPAGLSDDGLPIGVQIVGPRWSDRQLLATARAMGEAFGSTFVPPPHAQLAG
jgi:amidase